MKYLWLIILPLLISAQVEKSTDKNFLEENYDWEVNDYQGCVLAISGDSINFEERWMHFVPITNATITSKEGTPIAFEDLRAPFWVEVSYAGKGRRVYIKLLRFLSQFEYENGYIIGEYQEDEHPERE